MPITKKPLSTIGEMSNNAIRSLLEVVGKDALFCLNRELDMPLCLYVARGEGDRIYYEVCDRNPGTRDLGMIFDELTDAVAAYDQIRRAGSWADFIAANPTAKVIDF